MSGKRPVLAMLAVMVMAVALAACGKSASHKLAASSSATSTTAVSAGAINVSNSALGKILVDAQGRTLYHNTKESASVIVCTGSCASTWPPLVAPGALAAGVPGALGTVSRPDGTTGVTYGGEPLYRFSGDSAPGDTNGQGVGGVWFVVTAAAASSPATTGPPVTAATATSKPATPSQPAVTHPPATTAPTAPPATSPPTTHPPTTMAPSPHPTTCPYPPCY